MQAEDRTFSICERAFELMRTYSVTAAPRSYEVWYTYVTGERPSLNTDLRSRLEVQPSLGSEEIDTLYWAHLSERRMADVSGKAGAEMLGEVGKIMSLLDAALQSTERYDASLTALSADLEGAGQPERLKAILDALTAATSDVASTNRNLETSLRESRAEIDALRHTLDSVRLESLTDPLTGIANRKLFETTLASTVEDAHALRGPLSLIVIDIDHFKRFNDTYGHPTGDQVLRLVSSTMRQQVDPRATLARFGGEEFAMILPGFDLVEATGCAETVRTSVERRELLKRATGESLGRVTVSLGVAVLQDGESATSLLERADACMYGAKRSGRNRTVTDGDARVPDAA